MPSRAWPAAYTAAVCFVVALALLFAEAARPDDDVADTLTAQFAALGGEGWTGADGSWSVGLPGGSVAWFFGDTFLGGITADGRRAASSSIVRNSALVQSPDGSFRTVTGGTPTAPRDLVPGNGMNDWFWPGPPRWPDAAWCRCRWPTSSARGPDRGTLPRVEPTSSPSARRASTCCHM